MLERVTSWFSSPPSLAGDERTLLLDAINTVEPLMKTVGRFEQKLAQPARHALEYCEGMAAAIPGPIAVDAAAYANDPLVHALFPTHDEIGVMLGKSRGVHAFLDDPQHCMADEIYFMLGMRMHEKKVLGMALHGDVVQSDVPQRILYFGDHTLREFGRDADETRRRLRAAGFYSLARSFANQMEVLREQKKSLREQRDITASRRTKDNVSEIAQKCAELDEQLRDATDSLMPERVLDAFGAWLKQPEQSLRLQQVSFSVDRMGVISDEPASENKINELSFQEVVFPELVSRDRRRWISIVARVQRSEAQAAVAQHQEATRYIII